MIYDSFVWRFKKTVYETITVIHMKDKANSKVYITSNFMYVHSYVPQGEPTPWQKPFIHYMLQIWQKMINNNRKALCLYETGGQVCKITFRTSNQCKSLDLSKYRRIKTIISSGVRYSIIFCFTGITNSHRNESISKWRIPLMPMKVISTTTMRILASFLRWEFVHFILYLLFCGSCFSTCN